MVDFFPVFFRARGAFDICGDGVIQLASKCAQIGADKGFLDGSGLRRTAVWVAEAVQRKEDE